MVINTNGFCFICKNEEVVAAIASEPPDVKQEPVVEQLPRTNTTKVTRQNLRCLPRHLKLDIKKSLKDKGITQPSVLATMEVLKLEVELCGSYAAINQKFNVLSTKLEIIKMQMDDCVKMINGKVEEASEPQKEGDFLKGFYAKDTDANVDKKEVVEGVLGKITLVEALRSETRNKCKLALWFHNYALITIIMNWAYMVQGERSQHL